MTRFRLEISGALGEFWRKEAEKELKKIQNDLDEGRITIDENGIVRNAIGRVVMSDMLEKVAYLTDKANTKATQAAYDAETSEALESYRRNKKPYTAEEKAEIRAAFGKDAKVKDIITGEYI